MHDIGVDPATEPEFLLDGPARGGDGVLSRTVRAVRGHSARTVRTRIAAAFAVILLALAALVASGVLLGRPPMTTLIATTPDRSMWLRVDVRAYDGGSAATVTESGLPNGAACELALVTREGSRLSTGGWRVGAQSGTWPMVGSVWVGPEDVVGVEVRVVGGPDLVG